MYDQNTEVLFHFDSGLKYCLKCRSTPIALFLLKYINYKQYYFPLIDDVAY